MANGDTKTQSYLDIAANGTRQDLPSDNCCNTRTQDLIVGVAERIMDVEDEVEELKNNPDVADIVATYADLQAYDTSKLTDKDIIRVLADETHDGDSTYYRYSKQSDTFTYVGESKQYTAFVGTDGTSAGVAGLVPAPATTDAGKYLKADGTWDSVQAGPTIVQTIGTSQTDVMSQDATSKIVFPDPSNREVVKIGPTTGTVGNKGTAIGTAKNVGAYGVGIGNEAEATGDRATAVGYYASTGGYNYSTAVGYGTSITGANATAVGYNAKSAKDGVSVGNSAGKGSGSSTPSSNSVCIGRYTSATANYGIAIGDTASTSGISSIAIGSSTSVTVRGSVALGAGASASTVGEVNIGASNTQNGYNNTNYRIISGVHDGQSAHDAVSVSQVNSVIDAINTALSTNIPHIGA